MLCILKGNKKAHIHFGCYLNHRYIGCVNGCVFEMLKVHICTHYDTIHCKQATSVSHFNGIWERGNA